MADPARKLHSDDDWSMSDRRERQVMRDSEAMSDTPDDRTYFSSRGKLSKAEIEALLRPDLSDASDSEPPAQTTDHSFDMFEETITDRNEDDARKIASAISMGLRQDCRLPAAAYVSDISTGDFSDAFAGSTQGSACLFFKNSDGQITCALILSSKLTTGLIDMACGGDGEFAGVAGRALTTIDGELLTSILSPIAPSLGKDLKLARTEIDVRFAGAMSPPGPAEIIDLSIMLGGTEAPARLAILHDQTPEISGDAGSQPAYDFAVAVLTARLATLSVPVSALSNLMPGSLLKLGIPADQPVELLSGGRDGIVAAEGEIGRKGNAIAVRVTRRGAYLRKASRKAKEIE